MQAKFTQDPWGLESDNLALTMGNQVVCGRGIAPDNATREERIANSRLIAASPRMWAALVACQAHKLPAALRQQIDQVLADATY